MDESDWEDGESDNQLDIESEKKKKQFERTLWGVEVVTVVGTQ